MNRFDEPLPPQDPGPNSESSSPHQDSTPAPFLPAEAPPDFPATQAGTSPHAQRSYPPDLQISWSWVHLIVFFIFGVISLLIVQTVVFALYAPHQKLTAQQFEQYMLSKPQAAIGGTVAVYALLLFFLYVTLALLHGQPFWSTLGWRSILPRPDGQPRRPQVYFFTGSALSLVVFGMTALVKTPEHTPIEEVYKFKETAMLFMAMAVLVAPLVEETIFRGYLYPMFARWFGVVPSIALTGFLFGLMHGPQLGGAKSLIAIMSFVGMVFTLVRARTGSVFASYLMHLGYNSLIAVSLLLATHGFTRMPTHH